MDIDENGPLMLSDKILCLKPFDAAGNHKYLDGTDQADTESQWPKNQFGSTYLFAVDEAITIVNQAIDIEMTLSFSSAYHLFDRPNTLELTCHKAPAFWSGAVTC